MSEDQTTIVVEAQSVPPSLFGQARAAWTGLTLEQLLAQCEVDTYRASGPGGQKRNKTSSAVRLRHLPSGLIVIAEESRSQHENKAKAMKRLHRTLFIELRETLLPHELTPEFFANLHDWHTAKDNEGRLHLSPKDSRFWPAIGIALDALNAVQSRVSDAAKLLGLTTGNLIDFLQTDPKVWQTANQLRTIHGQKPLR